MRIRYYFISLALVIISSCSGAESKPMVVDGFLRTNNWHGPTAHALDSYANYYYDVPHYGGQLLEFIQKQQSRFADSPEMFMFGDADYIIKDLRRHPSHYKYYGDSCLVKTSYGENVVLYSPCYLLRNQSELKPEQLLLLFEMIPRFYDSDGKSLEVNNDFVNAFQDSLKCIRAEYNSHLIRTDLNIVARTLFTIQEGKGLSVLEFDDVQADQYSINSPNGNQIELNGEINEYCRDYYDRIESFVIDFIHQQESINKVCFIASLKGNV